MTTTTTFDRDGYSLHVLVGIFCSHHERGRVLPFLLTQKKSSLSTTTMQLPSVALPRPLPVISSPPFFAHQCMTIPSVIQDPTAFSLLTGCKRRNGLSSLNRSLRESNKNRNSTADTGCTTEARQGKVGVSD